MRITQPNPLVQDIENYLDLVKQVETASQQLHSRMKHAFDARHHQNLIQQDILHIVELTEPSEMTPEGAHDILGALHDMRVVRRANDLLVETFGSNHKDVAAMVKLAQKLRASMSENLAKIPKNFNPRTDEAQDFYDRLRALDGRTLGVQLEDCIDIRRDPATGECILLNADGSELSRYADTKTAVLAARADGRFIYPSPLNLGRITTTTGGLDANDPWAGRHRLFDPATLMSGETSIKPASHVWVELLEDDNGYFIARDARFNLEPENRFVYARHRTTEALITALYRHRTPRIIPNRALATWTRDWVAASPDEKKPERQKWCHRIQLANIARDKDFGNLYHIVHEGGKKPTRIIRVNDGSLFGEYAYPEDAFLDAAKHGLRIDGDHITRRRMNLFCFPDPVYMAWRAEHAERYGIPVAPQAVHTDRRPDDERVVTTDGRLARDIQTDDAVEQGAEDTPDT